MKKKRVLNLRQPPLFRPSVRRHPAKRGIEKNVTLGALKETNILSTSSFRYDNPDTGLRSTQEIDVDYTGFENHTFFNSAISKVNVAFDRIINEFPFDGTGRETEVFVDSLTGYEKNVFDNFPKNVGYLIFSGTVSGDNDYWKRTGGTYLKVNDKAGTSYPEFSKNRTGNNVINPGLSSFSIEMQIFPTALANDNQVICQMLSGTDGNFGDGGFTLGLSSSTSTSESTLIFAVVSGSTDLHATGTINKGQWNHICATFNRSPGVGSLLLYVSGNLIASSSAAADEMGTLSFNSLMPLYIGSGSAQNLSVATMADNMWTPVQTLSGAIDEFRFFHKTRPVDDQKATSLRSIYPVDDGDLRLYFKFNEPSGSYSIPEVVLDSSGYSLHTSITNFDSTNTRLTGSSTDWGICLTGEDKSLSPILFPTFNGVRSFNADLLHTASLFDNQNPNLITRLIPPHYLEEGAASEGFNVISGSMGNMIKSNSVPGSAVIGSPQIMSAFLLIWAKYFDEMKIFIDHFSNLIHVDYDTGDSASDKFLPFVARYYGFDLPALFANTQPGQYIEGRNIDGSYSISPESLKLVQNQIWKRILINMNDIITSKGTRHSIESLFRAVGIDPDSFFTIREYGGPTKKSLTGLRQTRKEVSTALSFTGSLAPFSDAVMESTSSDGLNSSNVMPIIRSPFLSGARVEVGYPLPQGSFINQRYVSGSILSHGTSSNPSDGLFTSGCFTYEAIYVFPSLATGSYPVSQSLVRFHVTGTKSPSDRNGVIANLIIVSGASNSLSGSGSDIKLFVRPSSGSTSEPTLELAITGADIFNTKQWNISFGRVRHDSPLLNLNSENAVSSSYFLRCASQYAGEITYFQQTSSFFLEVEDGDHRSNAFSNSGSYHNASGSFFVIGSQSLGDPTGNYFLNDESVTPDGAARVTTFAGRLSQIRFWSKALETNEWKEHVRNFKSLGVKDPLVNFNFNTLSTGSFEKLRIDASTDQRVTASNSQGGITIFNFTQDKTSNLGGSTAPWAPADSPTVPVGSEATGTISHYHLSGTGFEANKSVIRPETFHFSFLSPKFDIGQTDNKVRIRSFKDPDKIKNSDYAGSAPVYEVPESEKPDDDVRFTIDYSAVKALDEDIMNIFSTLEFFDDALGQPNLMFDDFYPDIEQMRKIYFNRLVDKINIKKFFEIFKWFDNSFSSLIEQMLPRKTKFLGINYVIESHVLERHRFRYLFDQIYQAAGERERTFDIDTLDQMEAAVDGTLTMYEQGGFTTNGGSSF